jgi:hypothetical protein
MQLAASVVSNTIFKSVSAQVKGDDVCPSLFQYHCATLSAMPINAVGPGNLVIRTTVCYVSVGAGAIELLSLSTHQRRHTRLRQRDREASTVRSPALAWALDWALARVPSQRGCVDRFTRPVTFFHEPSSYVSKVAVLT